MFRCVVAVAAAAVAPACFSPSSLGPPCASDRSCPAGLVCVDQPDPRCVTPTADAGEGGADAEALTDATPLADAAPDGDADGVADAVDNCVAVANPTQANEDGDPLGNLCDPCPHLAGLDAAAAAADRDGDLVGDACDPRSTSPGDVIAMFLPFDDPSELGRLEPASASAWSISGGALRVDVGDGEISAIWSLDQFTPRGTVVAGLTPTMLQGAGAGNHSISVLREVSSNNHAGEACFQSNGNPMEIGWAPAVGVSSLGTPAAETPYPVPVAPDRAYVMSATRLNNQRTCRVATVGHNDVVAISQFSGNGAGVGLRVRAVDVAFPYLVVITSP
ncbi:MAG: thrombospondin type 3 repeat-containing protein [Kofleriaceae bacterium]|jgi:hypothetical protein|nr:thrombospondin type 3 repeat-containing protein [Kofleriaceae bacterium]